MFLLPFAAADDGMERFWQSGPEWLVFCIAVVAILVTVAWYVIDKIRPKPEKKEPLASQWLSKYREMHSRGVLSDEEFRTIKTTLNKQLQDELKRNDEDD
jgi:5-bromo-4-chloroindolyl phosphate hydrolysis protein